MSDYGFKTFDESETIALNAKNPIFGFDMGHKPRAFKTFRITDAKQSPIHTGNPGQPNPQPVDSWGWDEKSDHGVIRELVKRVKHGYNFRPVGYAVITGTLKCSTHIQFTQTQYAGDYGGNYSRTLTKQNSMGDIILTPNVSGKAWFPYTGISAFAPIATLTESDFSGTTWAYPYQKNIMTMPYPSDQMSLGDMLGLPNPIEVVIDDQYINFYRTHWWSDSIRRAKFTYGGTVYDDLQERVKVSTQFTGSVYNITVYLCPFPLKELL